MPTITIAVYLSPRRANGTGRWAHLSGGEATLLSSHAGRFRMSEGRQEPWGPRRTRSLGANPSDAGKHDTDPVPTGLVGDAPPVGTDGARGGCLHGLPFPSDSA